MTSKRIIETLDKYEFHDMSIESVSLHDDNGIKLILTALPFNVNTNDYGKLKLTFSELKELKMDQIRLNSDSDIEIFTFDYEYKECFDCKLVLLLGVGEPSLTIEVKCQNIQLEDV